MMNIPKIIYIPYSGIGFLLTYHLYDLVYYILKGKMA